MDLFKTLKDRVRASRCRVILPETHDARVVLGPRQALADRLREAGGDGNRIEVLDPADPDRLESLAQAYYERRRHKGITPEGAR